MALLTSEVWRLKAELGYSVLNVGASPYIGISSLVEQVIVPNLTAGTITTSSSAVATPDPTSPVPATITLASGAGFNNGDRVVVDVDDAQETVTARSVSGASLVAMFARAHTGTYPVTVEGPESIIREDLARIREKKKKLAETFGVGALKKVDEVEFYQLQVGQSLFGELGNELMYWRDELCSHLGIANPWRLRVQSGSRMAVY